MDVQGVRHHRLNERLWIAFDLPAERRQDASAVLAPAIDDRPAICGPVAPVAGAVAPVRAGRRVDVDLAALPEVQLPLEPVHGLPGDGAVPVSCTADCPPHAHDIGIDASQLVQVVDLKMARQRRAHPQPLPLQHHFAQLGLEHEVEQVPPVLGQRVDQQPIALPVVTHLDDQVRVQTFIQVVVGKQ